MKFAAFFFGVHPKKNRPKWCLSPKRNKNETIFLVENLDWFSGLPETNSRSFFQIKGRLPFAMESGYPLPFPIHFCRGDNLAVWFRECTPEVSIIKELSWGVAPEFWRFEGSSSIMNLFWRKLGKRDGTSQGFLYHHESKPRGKVESNDSKEKHFIYKKSALEIATYIDGFAKNLKGFSTGPSTCWNRRFRRPGFVGGIHSGHRILSNQGITVSKNPWRHRKPVRKHVVFWCFLCMSLSSVFFDWKWWVVFQKSCGFFTKTPFSGSIWSEVPIGKTHQTLSQQLGA